MRTKNALVPVGICLKPHGIRGRIIFKPFNSSTEMVSAGKRLFTGEGKEFLLREAKISGRGLFMICLEGVADRDSAEEFRNTILFCKRSSLEEPNEGEYYCCDLIGLPVRDRAGNLLGVVKDVIKTNADILQVVGGGKEYLAPMVEGTVFGISENGIVVDEERVVSNEI